MFLPTPIVPPSASRSRFLANLVAILWLGALVCRCSPPAAPLPELPGTQPGVEWFWRDVLAAALPGETAARQDILSITPPAALIDALSKLSLADDPATLTTLLSALRHDSEGVACVAARELGLRGDRAAMPRLIKSIGPYPVDYDVPVAVRAAAASALARLGNPAGIPLILSQLAEGTSLEADRASLPWTPTPRMAFVQELALEGLADLAGTDFGFDPNGSVADREAAVARARTWWQQHRTRLWNDLGALDSPGLLTRARLLVAHLRAYQLRQIDGAVYTLGQLGPGVIPLLETGLASSDDYLRLHVLDVMIALAGKLDRKTRGQLAILASAPLLGDASPAVAARAAAVCGATAVSDPLINALQRRTEAEVRLAIVDALGETGLESAREVLDGWSAEEPSGRPPPDLVVALEAARLALDRERPLEAFLAQLASDDPSLAYPALERLIRLIGSDHGWDPSQPAETQAETLASITTALRGR